ncbi:MAG: hypothetical protein H7232_15740 [Aeromicrobium sp.]|nr:hypothetical protein [Burkholderiales bacterium]
MKRHYLMKLVVAWMVAWLPVAGVLASTMPITSASVGFGVDLSASMAIVATTDSDAAVMPCHTFDASATEPDGKSCSHCVLCHLAGAIAPPTMPTLPQNTLHDSPESLTSVAFTSFIAELPQRPPSPSRA